jgi:hypothetical protein
MGIKGIVMALALGALQLFGCAHAQDSTIYSPDVFNWRFYLNNHPDLTQAGIVTEQAAKTHWQQFGVKECRRAHPDFHTSQYLLRYSDLQRAYGTDCKAALNHYLVYGRNEHRKGLLGTYYQGRNGRVTIGNGVITLGMSTRVAGAIDSLYVGGREYINSWDHGRQMQIAWTVNGTGECNNPTEAGSSANGIHNSSSSRWVSHSETAATATTVSYPAFWLKPTDRADCADVVQLPGHKLQKYVQVGVPGVSAHLIELISQVTIPAATSHLVIETPATYLGGEFTWAYTWDPSTCQVARSYAWGEKSLPVIAATSNGISAIGAWSPDLPSPGFSTVGYGRAQFLDGANPANSTNKINAVYRRSNIPAGTYEQQTFIAAGTLEEVRTALCAAKATFD